MWVKRAASSDNKNEALTNLFRAVQPHRPRPPTSMLVDGVRAGIAVSHEGWKRRMIDERSWAGDLPTGLADCVDCKLRGLLREAGQIAATEQCGISLVEVQTELCKWGASTALPNDWIPRAALRTKLEEVDRLIWCVVAGAWRLLVKPSLWGVSKQDVIFKKGDLDIFKSWRSICINNQLGLLTARLFWNRVVTDVRQAIGKFQTGYTHRCEYHALTFHEVAAARVHSGTGLVALFGDLVGAFPKAWRELILVLAAVSGSVVGSKLILLREFFRFTAMEVTCSGSSVLELHSGLPEGGLLGPLLYPLLPAVLDRMLASARMGIGFDIDADAFSRIASLDPLDFSAAQLYSSADASASLRLHILRFSS